MTKAEAIKALKSIAETIAYTPDKEDEEYNGGCTGDTAYDMIVEVRDVIKTLGLKIPDKVTQ